MCRITSERPANRCRPRPLACRFCSLLCCLFSACVQSFSPLTHSRSRILPSFSRRQFDAQTCAWSARGDRRTAALCPTHSIRFASIVRCQQPKPSDSNPKKQQNNATHSSTAICTSRQLDGRSHASPAAGRLRLALESDARSGAEASRAASADRCARGAPGCSRAGRAATGTGKSRRACIASARAAAGKGESGRSTGRAAVSLARRSSLRSPVLCAASQRHSREYDQPRMVGTTTAGQSKVLVVAGSDGARVVSKQRESNAE